MQKEMKTLKEVCNLAGTTRRAVQGFERYGLVRPSGKNKYGYLLYDDNAVERILFICFLQNLRFTLREIAELLDLPMEKIRVKILSRVNLLRNQIERYGEFLDKTEELLPELSATDLKDTILEIKKTKRSDNEKDYHTFNDYDAFGFMQ